MYTTLALTNLVLQTKPWTMWAGETDGTDTENDRPERNESCYENTSFRWRVPSSKDRGNKNRAPFDVRVRGAVSLFSWQLLEHQARYCTWIPWVPFVWEWRSPWVRRKRIFLVVIIRIPKITWTISTQLNFCPFWDYLVPSVRHLAAWPFMHVFLLYGI